MGPTVDVRRRDAASLMRTLLRALEQKPEPAGAANAADGAAAAESPADAVAWSLAFWTAVENAENGPMDPDDFGAFVTKFYARDQRTLHALCYPSDENDGKCVVSRADLLYSLSGMLSDVRARV
jgi:hypothetical protein